VEYFSFSLRASNEGGVDGPALVDQDGDEVIDETVHPVSVFAKLDGVTAFFVEILVL
jgi:hypothetical protein